MAKNIQFILLEIMNKTAIHIYIYGFTISLLWRLINIRNSRINMLNADAGSALYVDDSEIDKNSLIKIDWVVLIIESSIGAFMAIFFGYLFIVFNVFKPETGIINVYDFLIGFSAIPGYTLFLKSRIMLNDFFTKKLFKTLFMD